MKLSSPSEQKTLFSYLYSSDTTINTARNASIEKKENTESPSIVENIEKKYKKEDSDQINGFSLKDLLPSPPRINKNDDIVSDSSESCENIQKYISDDKKIEEEFCYNKNECNFDNNLGVYNNEAFFYDNMDRKNKLNSKYINCTTKDIKICDKSAYRRNYYGIHELTNILVDILKTDSIIIIPIDFVTLFLEVIFHIFYVLGKKEDKIPITICSPIFNKLSKIVNIQSEWLCELFSGAVYKGIEPFSFSAYDNLTICSSVFDITSAPKILFLDSVFYDFLCNSYAFDNISKRKPQKKSRFDKSSSKNNSREICNFDSFNKKCNGQDDKIKIQESSISIDTNHIDKNTLSCVSDSTANSIPEDFLKIYENNINSDDNTNFSSCNENNSDDSNKKNIDISSKEIFNKFDSADDQTKLSQEIDSSDKKTAKTSISDKSSNKNNTYNIFNNQIVIAINNNVKTYDININIKLEANISEILEKTHYCRILTTEPHKNTSAFLDNKFYVIEEKAIDKYVTIKNTDQVFTKEYNNKIQFMLEGNITNDNGKYYINCKESFVKKLFRDKRYLFVDGYYIFLKERVKIKITESQVLLYHF
ncbi:hypothetical protein EDEG_03201 [Edhazardia aedis USNM 41457]|uniref:Beta-Casp domain-containing protein n=1 Tax=Edhazardia aedis (strain USNM 41457) TaxID=1003232 RepID=J9DIB9_EDHAE|nr:hypothetical protein EDEG_03201 [Edhazardia aedis USNM 41457]|eukprot:EJW02370.1 hypothetical protein EDEG_03201 [Edhazardia aedis USNM 41457]